MFEEIVPEYSLNEQEVLDIKASKAPKKQYCPYFEECGGCQLLSWDYAKQVEWKKAKLAETFKRDLPFIEAESITAYRHKNNFSYKQDKLNIIAGYFKPKSHRLMNIKHCLIQDPIAEKIFLDIKEIMRKTRILPYDEMKGEGVLRHALVRVSNATKEVMLTLVVGQSPYPGRKNFIQAIRNAHPEITTIIENVHPEKSPYLLGKKDSVVFGRGTIEEHLLNKTFFLQSRTFFQVHVPQAEKLFSEMMKRSAFSQDDVVVDAYAGVGVIGMLVADKVKAVISVESNPDSIAIGQKNAKYNRLDNMRFIKADATQWIQETKETFNVLIMDPPRSGAGEGFMIEVLKKAPKKIIYISCNPLTQVQDIRILGKRYVVNDNFGIDLFPQTVHVESVLILERV